VTIRSAKTTCASFRAMGALPFVVLILLASASPARAHRLDEYLQATRIGLSQDRVELNVDLTPGAGIGPSVLTLIDQNNDGQISPSEARRYAARVADDFRLDLNGRSRTLRVLDVKVPLAADLVDGLGTIHLDLEVVDASLTAGHSSLTFRNEHQPSSSVYLVNALKPTSAAIEITGQERDQAQQGVRLTFDVSGSAVPAWSWLVIAVVALGAVRYRPFRVLP